MSPYIGNPSLLIFMALWFCELVVVMYITAEGTVTTHGLIVVLILCCHFGCMRILCGEQFSTLCVSMLLIIFCIMCPYFLFSNLYFSKPRGCYVHVHVLVYIFLSLEAVAYVYMYLYIFLSLEAVAYVYMYLYIFLSLEAVAYVHMYLYIFLSLEAVTCVYMCLCIFLSLEAVAYVYMCLCIFLGPEALTCMYIGCFFFVFLCVHVSV